MYYPLLPVRFDSALTSTVAMVVAVTCLFTATDWVVSNYLDRQQEQRHQDAQRLAADTRMRVAQQEQQARDARAAGRSGDVWLVSDGVLEQAHSGLQWRQRDNGRDVSWQEARDYCGSLSVAGGGWQLPTASELQSLYDPNDSATASCGGSTCKVSALFELSSPYYWTNNEAGGDSAWYVSLEHGGQFADSVRVLSSYRALCVRRS